MNDLPRRRARRASASKSSEQASSRSALLTRGAALSALLFASLLCLGGLPPRVTFGLGAVVLVLGAASLWKARPLQDVVGVWALLGLSAYSLVQTLPLPLGLARLLSPSSVLIQERVAELAGAHRTWLPLSLDVQASSLEALKFATYAVFTSAALELGRAGKRNIVYGTVFGAGLVLTVIALGHAATHATSLFGLYTPSTGLEGAHLVPLLNPNHCAAYLILAGFAGLALPTRKDLGLQIITYGAVAWLFAAAVLTGSRGGAGALAGGLVVYALVRPGASKALVRVGIVGLLALAVIGFVALGASDETYVQLFGRDTEKLLLLGDAARLLKSYAWTGLGRGAFESVASSVHDIPDNIVFSHPENLPLQWGLEWGVPVSLLACGALFVSFRPRRLGLPGSLSGAAVVAAVSAFLAQNLLDFSSEVPAVALAVLGCLGVARGSADRRASRQRSTLTHWYQRNTRGAALAVLAGSMICVLAQGGPTSLRDERIALEVRARTARREPARLEEVRAELGRAMLAHPADYYAPLLRAWLDEKGDDRSPFVWLGYALERCPGCGRPHIMTARAIGARNPKQALSHVRWAVEHDNTLHAEAAELAVSLARSEHELLTSVPAPPAGGYYLLDLIAATPDQRYKLALQRLLADRSPDQPEVRLSVLRAWATLAAQKGCEPEECVRGMTEELAHFNARERVLGWDELGRALVFDVRGQPAAAAALLQKVCPSHAALEPDCSREAVRLAALLPDAAPLEAAARLLRNGACRSSSECALGLEQLGAAYEARGELGRAASTYVEAAEAEPNASRYARAAHAAERARLFSMALNAYQSASHLEAGAAYDGDVQRLRELILLQNSPPDVLPTP